MFNLKNTIMQKLFSIIAVSFLFAGCSKPAYEACLYTDYTQYTANGFLVSPLDTYPGHTPMPIGQIEIVYTESADMFGISTDNMHTQKLLEKMVAKAKTAGANGLINYKIDYTPGTKNSRPTWTGSGVAVRFNSIESTASKKSDSGNIMPREEPKEYKKYDVEAARKARQNHLTPLIITK